MAVIASEFTLSCEEQNSPQDSAKPPCNGTHGTLEPCATKRLTSRAHSQLPGTKLQAEDSLLGFEEALIVSGIVAVLERFATNA